MNDLIKIGTRESKLAVWQAVQVKDHFDSQKINNELIYIKSEGDINLTTPLYELGVQGIFTKALDIALLQNEIDLAVHSHKDVPTQLAKGLQIAAVLKRGNPFDVLVLKGKPNYELQITNCNLNVNNIDSQFTTYDSRLTIDDSPLTIATSSIRRKAQWLHKYPNYTIDNLRGNVITRVQKLKVSDWQGAIFAVAGLQRLGLTEHDTGPQVVLDWMLPAPAQGAVVIVCRKDDKKVLDMCAGLNDRPTQLCTQIERGFLRILQGGCSTPIAAFAEMIGEEIVFKGNITAIDGSEQVSVELRRTINDLTTLAQKAADEIINKGGKKLLV